MTSLNKRSVDVRSECIQAFKKIRQDTEDAAALCVVGKIFHNNLFPTPDVAKLHTMNKHYTKLRKEIGEEFPELRGAKILPSMPVELSLARKQLDLDAVNAHILTPIKIDADLMLLKALQGLKEGLADKIYPEVKLCMSFLCCIRSHDLNPKFMRSNGAVPKLGSTHAWLEDFCGTFAMIPSKQRPGDSYKAFANITIVQKVHHPLIKKALEFLLDPLNSSKTCYGSAKDYLARRECGSPTAACEWGDRVSKKMIQRLGLKDAILDWNGWEGKEFINESFARRFVACCVHKEIIKLDDNLNVGTLAADMCLGHVTGSTATRTYLRYNVRPTQVDGLILKKIEKPIKWAPGEEITTGLYLEQT